MATYLTIHLILTLAALLLALLIYSVSRKNFLEKYQQADNAITVILIMAAIAVTLIYA